MLVSFLNFKGSPKFLGPLFNYFQKKQGKFCY